jgi:gluconate 5-dehydrogenase
LAAAGAQVIGVARRAEALSDWAERIGPKAATLSADLSERSQIKEIAAQIATPFGAPNIVVHAAGINTREAADHVTNEGWDISLNLNLATPFFPKSGACADMKAKGWGRIVNFASLQTYARVSGRRQLRRFKSRHCTIDARNGRSLVGLWD